MAGIANDYLIYPIMDLVKAEVQKSTNKTLIAGDPFAGTPSVRLYRDHPLDAEKITGAYMLYESDYSMDVYMTFGIGDGDMSGIPLSINPEHSDWEYYTVWRLAGVTTISRNPDGKVLVTLVIRLNYENETGALIGTTVTRI